MALEINPNRSSGEGFNLNDKIIREQQLAGKNKSSHNPPIHEEEKSFEGKNGNSNRAVKTPIHDKVKS